MQRSLDDLSVVLDPQKRLRHAAEPYGGLAASWRSV
jgi:hypothetical protein